MTTSLDDPNALSLDHDGMFGWIAELGTQLIRAWHESEGMELPARASSATSVIVAGMGGSATGGDYFAALCAPVSEIPVTVVRGYSLPNYVSEQTFVIVSSYSGNTEESLSCYDDAWKRGASIVVLTTGGKLAERAASDGVPVHTITYRAHPRAALAHSMAPLLRLGTMTGICPCDGGTIQLAGELHRSFVDAHLAPSVPQSRNRAKQIAEAIHGRVAFALGAEHLASAASRFKNQLAENGKALGAADALPEADHNLLVGLGTGSAAAKSVSLVTIESPRYNTRTRKRFEVTTGLFEAAGIPVHRLEIAGSSPLQDLLLATAWGDYVSCYLALLNGQDPGPVPQVDLLKAALAS
jgi:glucose/mannose-6-phosphate isomerase